MKKLLLFSFLFLLLSFSFSEATIRYVSHSGTNTPPYLTWETAADSIMSAINISSFGDTIYVANGVYKEIVTMIPGVALIGAGMDSTIIDTRDLAYSGFHSVDVVDSCLLKGFYVIVSYNTDIGYGIYGTGNNLITLNKVSNGVAGFYINSNSSVYKNFSEGNRIQIKLYSSNSLIRKNIVHVGKNYSSGYGLLVDAISTTSYPMIDSNLIEIDAGYYGIQVAYGGKPIISNNTILLKDPNTIGIQTGFASDTTKIFNNLIIAESGEQGIMFFDFAPLLIKNNYCSGNFDDYFNQFYTIEASNNAVVENNVVTNAGRGIKKYSGSNAIVKYNNSWNNQVNYSGVNDTTNLSVDPMIVNNDSTQGELDFHLQAFSPLIDKGDANILDIDSTRSDIGIYGGPYGESYKYLDLPPRSPVNLSGIYDSLNNIKIMWNPNTEADFNHYNIFRDTIPGFPLDSTTFVLSLTDTAYIHMAQPGVSAYYYKLTASDNQGNQSGPSEELQVLLTGTKTNEQFTINNYKLFQNYPNPFNPSTKIGYRLKERGYVKLYVYDIKGELVETLVNKYQEGGYYEVSFEVKSQKSRVNSDLASGVYIYQILVSNKHNIPVYSEIKKMILIK